MFTFNIDLGQIIIVAVMSVIGWFVKRTIDKFESQIDKHEAVIFTMNSNIQRIIGAMGLRNTDSSWDFKERRSTPR